MTDTREGLLLQVALTHLLVIARGPCHAEVCRWDRPCGACFAANAVARFLECPEFRAWKQDWKVVRKRKPRKAKKK